MYVASSEFTEDTEDWTEAEMLEMTELTDGAIEPVTADALVVLDCWADTIAIVETRMDTVESFILEVSVRGTISCACVAKYVVRLRNLRDSCCLVRLYTCLGGDTRRQWSLSSSSRVSPASCRDTFG